MTLQELMKSVKEEHLSKDDLEKYRDQLSYLYANLQLEMADLEKQEALFMENTTEKQENITVARAKILWKSTEAGQRLIVLKRYCLATKELLNSLKSRLYSVY